MELKDVIETGLKSVETKLSAAIDKFEGQLIESGKADGEIRNEVKSLADQYKSLNDAVNDIAQKQTAGLKTSEAKLSAGEEFVKSAQYQALVKGEVQRARLEVKNTVTSAAGTVFPEQRPGIIPGSFVPLTVRDVLRTIPVSSNMVNSLREASNTNAAAFTAQTAAKPESSMTFEPYNVAIETVAHWIKISNQLMADAPAVVAYIENRLRDGLAQKIEQQLINGDGTSPNLSGLTDAGNFVAYTAAAGDNLVDAINKAKYTMWATGNTPDTVIVNPADWGAMERTREGAASGMYLYGLPGTGAGMNPFGLQVVISTYLPAGKLIVARLSDSAVLYARSGAVVEMGYVNDDFTKNLVTIRAEERLGLGVDRPAGIYFGSITGA